MPTYVIERTVPCVGQMSSDGLRDLAAQSNDVLRSYDGDLRWSHSYVTDDKIICIYESTDEGLIRDHGRRGGFPVDEVHVVHATIDPSTGGAS